MQRAKRVLQTKDISVFVPLGSKVLSARQVKWLTLLTKHIAKGEASLGLGVISRTQDLNKMIQSC